MKNWESYQMKLASAKTATEFICMIADFDQNLVMHCCKQMTLGKCNANSDVECGMCKMKWLNAERDEKEGELFKWMTH